MKKPKSRDLEASTLTLAELRDQLDVYSDRISTQLRTVSLGVLAVVWVLLLKSNEVISIAQKVPERWLMGIAVACIAELTLDLLQYLAAERAVDEAFDRAERSVEKAAAYDANSIAYRAQLWCYRLKLWVTLGAVLALVVAIGSALLS